jgi:hypothetical protein
LPYLTACDILQAASPICPAAIFYLDKIKHARFLGDNIYFAPPRAPVLFEYCKTVAPQIICGYNFGLTANVRTHLA